MDSIKSYLPQHDGWLPYWLLLFGGVAVGNSIQSYTTLYFTSRIYSGPKPAVPYVRPSPSAPKYDLSRTLATPLSARTFGTWTFMAAVIRLYAAYNIDNPAFYSVAVWTYGIAFVHFMLEWFWFQTCTWGAPIAGPVIGSAVSLVWMYLQKDFYIK